MKPCSRCDTKFIPKVSYQIYCSQNCRDESTKEKIAERYRVTKLRKRKSKDRRCRNCSEKLSMYAEGPLCYFCNIDPKLVNKALRELKKIGIVDYEQDKPTS